MISLAPLKYRNILASRGGPISHILTNQIDGENGEMLWESYAYLVGDFSPRRLWNWHDERPDGSGTDQSRSIAIHKAISEAIERWACGYLLDKKVIKYGFDIDPSTNGMACFPGFLPIMTRKIARLESIERWALINWWSERLNHSFIDANELPTVEIHHPFSGVRVVIVRGKCDFGFIYGFAAGQSLSDALFRAKTELLRNKRLIGHLRRGDQTIPSDTQNKRILYFSGEEGSNAFNNRSASRIRLDSIIQKSQMIVDEEIKGPWSRYGSVWRCLIDGDYMQAYQNEKEFFFF